MRAPPLCAVLLLAGLAAAHAQPADIVDGRTFFLPMVAREASLHGLPPEIADAVAQVETGYRPDAVGSSGEIGLMQVMPATAAQLGFHGTLSELADPETNIRLGVAYLARAWTEGGGDICRALTKYRAGLGQEVMTPLSAQYCARATAWLMGGNGVADAQGAIRPTAPADPYVIAMPPARSHPVPPMPEGVRLTPIFAMAQASHPHHPSHNRQNPAEPASRSDD